MATTPVPSNSLIQTSPDPTESNPVATRSIVLAAGANETPSDLLDRDEVSDDRSSETFYMARHLDAALQTHHERGEVHNIYEAFADFLQVDVANGDATEDTVEAYYREVYYWVKWCQQQGVEPSQAKRSHVETYRRHLKDAGLSATTRQHKLSIVRRFYEAAVKHNLIKSNPATNVRGGKDLTPPEEKIKALTRNALVSLVASIPGDTLGGKRDRAIVALMAVHGLRRIEVHRLNHESINTDGDTPSLTIHGKGNRIRRVFLRQDTFNTILNYIQAKLEAGLPLAGALFLANSNRTRGNRISRRSINDAVDHYLNATALKRAGVSCHALRHTHGTLAVAGGAKVEHLRDEMGHTKLETTGLYVKAVERVKHNPANFIDVEF